MAQYYELGKSRLRCWREGKEKMRAQQMPRADTGTYTGQGKAEGPSHPKAPFQGPTSALTRYSYDHMVGNVGGGMCFN